MNLRGRTAPVRLSVAAHWVESIFPYKGNRHWRWRGVELGAIARSPTSEVLMRFPNVRMPCGERVCALRFRACGIRKRPSSPEDPGYAVASRKARVSAVASRERRKDSIRMQFEAREARRRAKTPAALRKKCAPPIRRPVTPSTEPLTLKPIAVAFAQGPIALYGAHGLRGGSDWTSDWGAHFFRKRAGEFGPSAGLLALDACVCESFRLRADATADTRAFLACHGVAGLPVKTGVCEFRMRGPKSHTRSPQRHPHIWNLIRLPKWVPAMRLVQLLSTANVGFPLYGNIDSTQGAATDRRTGAVLHVDHLVRHAAAMRKLGAGE